MAQKIKIIANPIAGAGRARKFAERLKGEFGRHHIDSEIKFTAKGGDAYEIALNHNKPAPIICLGGDGTVNEVINGIMNNHRFSSNNRPPLGVIPFGSGNVIAKELSLKRNTKHFLHLYKNNLMRYLDVGRIHLPQLSKKRYFISMAGIGFDAEVARNYHLERNGSSRPMAHILNYVPHALQTLSKHKMPKITIEIDGKEVAHNASFIQVANVRSYGGPFVMVNNAVFDDGYLDVMWFKGKSPINILLYYTLAFLETASPVLCSQRRAKKIHLRSDEEVQVQIDGDYCGPLPATIEIIPKGIQVYTPLHLPASMDLISGYSGKLKAR